MSKKLVKAQYTEEDVQAAVFSVQTGERSLVDESIVMCVGVDVVQSWLHDNRYLLPDTEDYAQTPSYFERFKRNPNTPE